MGGSSGTPGTTTAPPPTDGCGSPQWATDQWCDDENNNADCNWDGGACCDNDFSGWDTYCTACECLEPTTTTTTTTTAPPPTSGCGSPQWANDQWCDDENNNEDCNWDGGACCNNTFGGWDHYCSDCECLDPNAGTGPTCEDLKPTKNAKRSRTKENVTKSLPKRNAKKLVVIVEI